jgi:zinc protease
MKIADSVVECELKGGGRVFIAPMRAKDVVSIEGSVWGGANMLPRAQSEIPNLAAELLDAGTATRSKDEIRGTLAALGATLAFHADGDRMHFSASCFPEDLGRVLAIAFDCLSHASFPASEVKLAQARLLGELEEQKTDTRAQGSIALAQVLYDPSHPNHQDSTKTRMEKAKAATRKELIAFGRMLGRGGLVLAIAGGVEEAPALRAVEKAAKLLAPGTAAAPAKAPNRKTHAASEKRIPIKDKANVDTYFGACVPYTIDSPEYLAFQALASMLGGRGLSTGHLMRTIRERDGYTYGIYAMPGGFEDGADGFFRIWATFSPATFEKAVAATRKEIGVFLKSGLTEDALARKKTETTGRYLISLSTTRGMAATLHRIGAEGKPLSYVDEYPERIEALTLEDIARAAKAVPFSSLALVAAGSFAAS